MADELLDRDGVLQQRTHMARRECTSIWIRWQINTIGICRSPWFNSCFFKLRSYRQCSMFKDFKTKLATKFFEPLEVLECVGTVAYHSNIGATLICSRERTWFSSILNSRVLYTCLFFNIFAFTSIKMSCT